MAKSKNILPVEVIASRIYLIRNQKVMLSFHLSNLYGVETRALVQAVKRNLSRFPEDFMFQLNDVEVNLLVSQNVIPHPKYLGGHNPYAFTEQGVAMLSTVLRSEKAIQINIAIMRAFVSLRQILSDHKELSYKLLELERKVSGHSIQIKSIFEVLNKLLAPPPDEPKRRIGFV